MPTSDAALIPNSDKAIGNAQQEATPNAASIPPAARTVLAVSGPIRRSDRASGGALCSLITGTLYTLERLQTQEPLDKSHCTGRRSTGTHENAYRSCLHQT